MKKFCLWFIALAIMVQCAITINADAKPSADESETGRYIVVLKDPSVSMYHGGVPGLKGTSLRATGTRKLDAASTHAQAYRSHLLQKHDRVLTEASEKIGRTPETDQRYTVVLNGFAARLSRGEAEKMARLPDVAFVEPERIQQLMTDAGPQWFGADDIWNGAAGLPAAKGEGIIVGVIDTGINPLNPSFQDPGPLDNYDFTNPLGKFVGVCDPENTVYDPSFQCNDKLIGAWDFTSETPGNPAGPVDVAEHGSHTASTAAGNRVNAEFDAGGKSFSRTISGVAPHANIIAYRGCGTHGCPNSATIAGIEQAVKDGVDVINYSIGGRPRDPWSTADALAMLAARHAGVFVSVSAGNNGPDAETIGSPSNSPWVMSVGASTHDRALLNTVSNLSSDGASLPDLPGRGFTDGLTETSIVYAGDFPNPDAPEDEPPGHCCTPYPPGTFDGQIVVCDRSAGCGRVKKSENVKAGGAGGFVLVNDSVNGASLLGDEFVLPGTAISHQDGLVLKEWLAANTGTKATITGLQLDLDDDFGDIMSSFSSRGPDASLQNVIKPDVSAPGVDILAANGIGGEISWGPMSGTSMASPHSAGAAALVRQLHPDWTPAEVQSAIMMTGYAGLLNEDSSPADIFDRGAGRVQANLAPQAGLIMNETYINYRDANPGAQGDPSKLNIPSLAQHKLVRDFSWKRTVENPTTEETLWTAAAGSGEPELSIEVSPEQFTIPPGETVDVEVTARVDDVLDEWLFGRVDFTAAGQTPLHWPVAVRQVLSNLESFYYFEELFSNDIITLENIRSAEDVTDFTPEVLGFSPGEEHTGLIWQDPTKEEYDDGRTPETGEYIVKKVLAPENSRLVAEIYSTTSPDLDLFIYNNTEEKKACASAATGSDEYCNIDNPEEAEYAIIVQNYTASDPSGKDPDSFTLGVAVVPSSSSENAVAVARPTNVNIPAGDPFDIDIRLDLDKSSQHWYGGIVAGSSPKNPADIGRANIDILIKSPTRRGGGGGGSGCFIDSIR